MLLKPVLQQKVSRNIDGLDYAGVRAGMPEVVDNLENSIDRLAGPKIWAKGMNSHVECEDSFVPRTTSDVPLEQIN